MSPRARWSLVAAFAVVAAVAIYVSIIPSVPRGTDDTDVSQAASALASGSLTVVTMIDGELAGGAAYRISPDPFSGSGNITIRDGDPAVDSSDIAGIISVRSVSDGTYSVIEVAGPEGREREILPRIVTILNGSAAGATFGSAGGTGATENDLGDSLEGITSITYSAKFECGTIRGSEGPLRPGHYDTDIGILNKQPFEVRVAWSATSNDTPTSTNAILKTLGPDTSSSIVCNDIRSVLGASEKFVEGFVLLEVPVDPIMLSSISGGSSVAVSRQEAINVLDVQVFYTANALEELPQPILADKIAFVITSEVELASLPQSMLGKLLDVTLPSEFGSVSDPAERVKVHLAQNYNMTATELASLRIEVMSVDVSVGAMLDDHAISLSKISPQARTG